MFESTRRSLVFGACAARAGTLASAGAATSAPAAFTKPRLLICFIFFISFSAALVRHDEVAVRSKAMVRTFYTKRRLTLWFSQSVFAREYAAAKLPAAFGSGRAPT